MWLLTSSGEIYASVKDSEFLEGHGKALSYRFIKSRKGRRIRVSTSVSFETGEADFANGAIGLYINSWLVSVASLNESEHKEELFDLPYIRHQATSRQNKTAMQALITQVVD